MYIFIYIYIHISLFIHIYIYMYSHIYIDMFQNYACIEGFFFLVLLLVDCDVHGHARGRSSNALNMARQVFSVTSWGHFRVYDTFTSMSCVQHVYAALILPMSSVTPTKSGHKVCHPASYLIHFCPGRYRTHPKPRRPSILSITNTLLESA